MIKIGDKMKKYISLFVIAGIVHSLFSLYWGFGGEAGLTTVGTWVFTLSANYGIWINIALLIVAVVKFLATIMPLTLTNHFDKRIYYVSLVGSVVLILYGGLNTLIGWLKMFKIIEIHNYYTAFGQAFVWDPLFLLWGIGLFVYVKMLKKSKRNNVV
ncbi:DUF3995 domain-containing protein [Mammaliicoccus fleurettii]|uniref:DUF3995 domain-containing protein n=1 Tax=Mammaliicoccus fleurettii TaxID=150056 RepID=UPI001F54538F|nr:DUF3995 domain-containing protein [Mammaliicoccus fleurettii]